MVRKIHILNHTILALAALLLVAVAIMVTDATAQAASSDNTALNVTVNEVLNVQITKPTTWATGATGDFLSNKITVGVVSNNANGFVASMTTDDTTTVMTNTAQGSKSEIPTLTADASSGNSFPENRWGYSTNGTTYRAMVPLNSANPIEIIKRTAPATISQDVYFGAKINSSLDSGTYTQGVIISVVSGAIDTTTNPVIPTNPTDGKQTPPVTPSTDTANDGNTTQIAATSTSYPGNSRSGVSVYTTTTTDNTAHTTTTETKIAGNATTTYQNPAGVTKTEINAGDGSSPVVAVLVGTAVAATAGGLFFLALGRRKNDE